MIKLFDSSNFFLNSESYYSKVNVISGASLKSSPKNVSMSLNFIMYVSSFGTNLFTILFIETYALIFCLFGSDPLQVLMFVCPAISELRFCGCCHSCLKDNKLILEQKSFHLFL